MRWVDLLRGNGPDQFLELELRCDDDERLRALVSDAVGAGYEHTQMTGPLMSTTFRVPKRAPSWDFYVDALSHRERVSALRGPGHKLSWAYCAVWCGAQTLWLEHAYAFATPECTAAEAAVLDALTRSSWVGVEAWSVEWGGDGYPRGVARHGLDAASLRAALGL